HRHEHRPYARRGRPAVLGDARAHTPDRGQGAAQAEAPEPEPQAAELPGYIAVSYQRSANSNQLSGVGFVGATGRAPLYPTSDPAGDLPVAMVPPLIALASC